MNSKIVKAISIVNIKNGKMSRKRLTENRFKLPKNNKISVQITKFKKIEEDNQVV